jgi:HlyD family secretion protein
MQGKRKFVIILALVAALGGLGYWLVFQGQRNNEHELRLSGHIEATETDLSFKVSGKIITIRVDEGDWINKGEVAGELEAQDLRDEVANAQARVAAAQANLAKMEAGYRAQEVQEAQAQMLRARADMDDKLADWHRYQNLYERKVVSASTRDKYESGYLMAKETYRSSAENYSKLKEGFRKEDIDQARGELAQAKASLELAQTRLGYATITSPVTGVVVVRPAQPGEVAAVGSPILTLADMDNIYFEGYIPETDLAKVKFGQKAFVTTDTYPGKRYAAWISFINSKAEFTPKTVETFKERVTLVYRTKIRCENPNYELKPGMPAEAVIPFDSPK